MRMAGGTEPVSPSAVALETKNWFSLHNGTLERLVEQLTDRNSGLQACLDRLNGSPPPGAGEKEQDAGAHGAVHVATVLTTKLDREVARLARLLEQFEHLA